MTEFLERLINIYITFTLRIYLFIVNIIHAVQDRQEEKERNEARQTQNSARKLQYHIRQ